MEKFNFSRKLFHLVGFFVPAILYFDIFQGIFNLQHGTRAVLLIITFTILFMMSVSELFRLNHSGFNQFYINNFGSIMKEAEKHRMNGVIPYMLSNAVIVAFFPAQVIFLAMAFLLIGDPFAAYFGANYGKFRFYNGKSLTGIIAFTLGSIAFGLLLMILFQISYGESLFSFFLKGIFNYKAFLCMTVGAIIAGLAEFFSGHALGGFLEDNLLIPIVASLSLCWMVVLLELSTWKELIFVITEIFN
jgi:dolichol kinase